MIGTCFPLSRPSAPAVSTTQTSGALNGRTLNAAPPASPRISCHSSWWAALGQGGFKGLRQWIVRTGRDRKLSIEDRNAKPVEAGLAIRAMLQTGKVTSPQWASDFRARLKDAAWYGADVNKAVNDAFSQMDAADLDAIRTACQNNKSLAWLARKVDERKAAATSFVQQLKHGLEQSLALSVGGFPLCGARQSALWRDIDVAFDSSVGCNLEESVRRVIGDAIVSKLLPLAEHHLDGANSNSKVLKASREIAFACLKGKKLISWDLLSDGELAMFSKLVKHHDLKHLKPAFEKELQRREEINKRHQVASYFVARLAELGRTSLSSEQTDSELRVGFRCPKLSDAEVLKTIVAKVIAEADPATIVKIARLKSTSADDLQLINAAKTQLEKPAVALLDHDHLVAYLRLPETDLPADARNLLENEAENRAEQASKAGIEVLAQALNEGSYRQLVRAVMEYAKLDRLKADLQLAAGIEPASDSPKIRAALSTLDSYRIVELQHLVIQLRDHGQTAIADSLNSVINALGRKKLQPLLERETQEMKEAVSSYFAKDGVSFSRLTLTAADEELKQQYFSSLMKSHFDENLVKSYRTDATELPVCIQFMLDQRAPILRVESRLVDGHSVFSKEPGDVRRTREAVALMRGQNYTDEQIRTVSRIVCQNTANTFDSILRERNFGSLSDAERKQGGEAARRLGNGGMNPAGLGYEANVVKNANENITVHLQIFQDNIKNWLGVSGHWISTDPLKSFFLSKLTFVVDTKGDILEDDMTFEMAFQREITNYGS